MIESKALEKLVDVYLDQFPADTAAEKTHLIKLVKAFYRAKGTEESYKFFFRAAYDAACEISYPKDNILIVSGGEWAAETMIRLESEDPKIFDITTRRIRGKSSGATAVIEDITRIDKNGFTIYDCRISAIRGLFDIGEIVETQDSGPKVRAFAFGVVNSVKLLNSGTGHTEGELIPVPGSDGYDLILRITEVNEDGRIVGVVIEDQGYNYTAPPPPYTMPNGTSFLFGAGVSFKQAGRYISEKSRISRYSVIQDGRLYQDYSYIVKTNVPVEDWYKDVKSYIHPAGLYFVGMLTFYANQIDGGIIDLRLYKPDYDPNKAGEESSRKFYEVLVIIQSALQFLAAAQSITRIETSVLADFYFSWAKIEQYGEQLIEDFSTSELKEWSKRHARVYPYLQVKRDLTVEKTSQVGRPSLYETGTDFESFDAWYNNSLLDPIINETLPDEMPPE